MFEKTKKFRCIYEKAIKHFLMGKMKNKKKKQSV